MGDLRLRLRTMAVAAALLSACSGHQSGTPKAPASPQVAVFGDSESQLLAQAQAARDAGQDPIWIHVQAPTKEYNFPVYAQLVRNNSALLVRAFGRLYAFPLSGTSVTYGSQSIDLKQIPLVDTPIIDTWLAGRNPGAFKNGNVDQKRSVCPDCLLLVRTKDTIRNITAHWSGKLDPWQMSPTYVAFTPTVGPDNGVPPLGIKPQLIVHGGNSCPNAYNEVYNSSTHTLYCYYAGSHYTNYNPYQYPGGPGGTGGSGGTGPTVPGKGTAQLTKCGSNTANATKQALAEAYTQSGKAGGNEYGAAVYDDGAGNTYILTWTSNSNSSVDTSGLNVQGYNLDAIVHDHWGFDDGGTFTDYDASNWQDNSLDSTTNNHFSPGDEDTAEYYGVPIWVVLGTVQQTYAWPPPAKDSSGHFNRQAPDQPLSTNLNNNKTDPNYKC